MNVKELMDSLKKLPEDAEVIIQKDSGGNSFSPLSCAYLNAVYVAENTYSGYVYDLAWSAKDADMDEPEWEVLKQKKSCVVLQPIN
jgi:hypothetical protein